MYYRVRARLRPGVAAELYRILTDGAVARQRPDGPEIVASMRRAISVGEEIHWTETCYCPTPLQHERATVYDRFFTEMVAELAPEEARPPEGVSFWERLREAGAQA
ncbi:MAG: hypothetical protein L0214_05445 [candidate division NC10 bacterium]|nr:hypothetical protein [candidate division NC10 bacterium]